MTQSETHDIFSIYLPIRYPHGLADVVVHSGFKAFLTNPTVARGGLCLIVKWKVATLPCMLFVLLLKGAAHAPLRPRQPRKRRRLFWCETGGGFGERPDGQVAIRKPFSRPSVGEARHEVAESSLLLLSSPWCQQIA
jgi:hypothetical protein